MRREIYDSREFLRDKRDVVMILKNGDQYRLNHNDGVITDVKKVDRLDRVEGATSLRKSDNTWARDQKTNQLDASGKIKALEAESEDLEKALRYSGPDQDRGAMVQKISENRKRIMFEKILKNPRVL
jgi:hypothetical protein